MHRSNSQAFRPHAIINLFGGFYEISYCNVDHTPDNLIESFNILPRILFPITTEAITLYFDLNDDKNVDAPPRSPSRFEFVGSGISHKATDAATSKPRLYDVLATFIPASSSLSNGKTEAFSTDDERTAPFLSIFSTSTPALPSRSMKKKGYENY
uniref:Uncharacterized protein n=1 Tax=Glossina pallidipes TaxID=7398 RepID=A0A1B0A821_GLOPL